MLDAKPTTVLSLVFFVLLVTFGAGKSVAQQPEGIMFFNAADGKGNSQAIPIGVYQVNGKQLGSGQLSVVVPKDITVRFCSGKDGTGSCEDFGEGTHNLTSSDFSFIRVARVVVTAPVPVATSPLVVYEELNWTGRSQMFSPGMYRSFYGEFGKIGDNHARSIIVAKGFKARLCVDEGRNYRGAGDCEVHEEGRHNLRFSRDISFIEVIDLSTSVVDDEKMPVILYEMASQVGRMQGFDVGEYSAGKGDFTRLPNDQASSIWVKDGYHAEVCSDEPAAGKAAQDCEEFGPGKKNLKSKKSASYIRVWK